MIATTTKIFFVKRLLSIVTRLSLKRFIVYVIGNIGFKNLNPFVTVSIGNVPPAAANCNTNNIKAINLPISLKLIIYVSIIAINVLATKIIEMKYKKIFVISKSSKVIRRIPRMIADNVARPW